MWVPVLTAALTTGEWILERQKRKSREEDIPVQQLTDAYFDAMADDIAQRLDRGKKLKDALKQVYLEQAPILLQPPPKIEGGKGGWALPIAIAAGALVGIGYWRRNH
jgi:hypothetical protein